MVVVLTLKVVEGAPSFLRSHLASSLIRLDSNYLHLPATRLRRDSLKVRRVTWLIVSNNFWIRVTVYRDDLLASLLLLFQTPPDLYM